MKPSQPTPEPTMTTPSIATEINVNTARIVWSIATAKGDCEGTLADVCAWQADQQASFAKLTATRGDHVIELDADLIDFDPEDLAGTRQRVADAYNEALDDEQAAILNAEQSLDVNVCADITSAADAWVEQGGQRALVALDLETIAKSNGISPARVADLAAGLGVPVLS